MPRRDAPPRRCHAADATRRLIAATPPPLICRHRCRFFLLPTPMLFHAPSRSMPPPPTRLCRHSSSFRFYAPSAERHASTPSPIFADAAMRFLPPPLRRAAIRDAPPSRRRAAMLRFAAIMRQRAGAAMRDAAPPLSMRRRDLSPFRATPDFYRSFTPRRYFDAFRHFADVAAADADRDVFRLDYRLRFMLDFSRALMRHAMPRATRRRRQRDFATPRDLPPPRCACLTPLPPRFASTVPPPVFAPAAPPDIIDCHGAILRCAAAQHTFRAETLLLMPMPPRDTQPPFAQRRDAAASALLASCFACRRCSRTQPSRRQLLRR